MNGKITTDTLQASHKDITTVRAKNGFCQRLCRPGLERLETDWVQVMFELLLEQLALCYGRLKLRSFQFEYLLE